MPTDCVTIKLSHRHPRWRAGDGGSSELLGTASTIQKQHCTQYAQLQDADNSCMTVLQKPDVVNFRAGSYRATQCEHCGAKETANDEHESDGMNCGCAQPPDRGTRVVNEVALEVVAAVTPARLRRICKPAVRTIHVILLYLTIIRLVIITAPGMPGCQSITPVFWI